MAAGQEGVIADQTYFVGNSFFEDSRSLGEAYSRQVRIKGKTYVYMVVPIAQTGAVAVLCLPENKGKTAYFAGINACKFKNKVVPGDRLRLECEIIKRKGPVGVGKATATVDGKVAAVAEITFAIG